MGGFLQTVPGIIVTVGVVLAGIIGGILYVLDLWKKGKNKQDDRLINILKDTVDALEVKVENQNKESVNLNKKIDDLTTKVDHLEKENATLTKVLQGRDEQTQSFYKKAFEAMETSNKTYALVEAMNKTQTELMKVLANHLKASVTINN